MLEETRNVTQCAEFESMLSDAMDEKLSLESLEGFQAHARRCSVCGPLLTDAEAGRRWLKSLAEVEPPQNLIENILVATTGLDTARIGADRTLHTGVTWWEQTREWTADIFAPALAIARQPRFAMSFGMAFFSLSISMSLAGVKLSDVRHLDLRPSAVKRSYYEASGRVVKYYENIRFVYEIESRVRDFKRATVPAEPAPEEKNKNRKDNTSDQPEKRQDRNYSQGEESPVLASLPNTSPVVTANTDRRFS